MEASDVPEVRFDEMSAQPIFPKPVLKRAALVPIPVTDGDQLLPTFIEPEWGGVQVFFGSYYGILGIVDGKEVVIYGSAKIQWENMHSSVQPGYWVKTAVPTAYRATEPCRIVTLIPQEDGSISEANFVLEPGDWIVRQPGGEVQHVKSAKFSGIYFSAEEADELSLTNMSAEQFATWALSRVKDLVGVS